MPQNGATETACLGSTELDLTIDTILRRLHTGPQNGPDDGCEQLRLL
jgi:hypothetical protein